MPAERSSAKKTGGAWRWLALCTCLTLMAGCSHGPRGLDHRPESMARLLAQKSNDGADLLGQGWALFVSSTRWTEALELLQRAAMALPPEQTPQRQQALLGQALIHLAQAQFEQAAQSFMATVELDPQSLLGLVAARQLGESADQIASGHARFHKRVQAVLDGQRPPRLEVSRALREFLRQGALRRGDWTAARQVEGQMGQPPVWRSTGGFGRHPLTGFSKSHPPEQKTWVKGGRTIWPAQGTLALESDRADAVHYGETYFKVDAPTRLSLRLWGEDSYAAFVDDRELIQHDCSASHLGRLERTEIKVSSGWHRLLVKLPLVEGRAELKVELTDPVGREAPITWWQESEVAPQYTPGSVENLGSGKGDLADLPRLIQDQPYCAATPLFAGLTAWEEGDPARAQLFFNEALKRAPGFALAAYLSALIALEDPDIPSGLDGVRSKEWLDKALRANPQFILARFRKALLESDQGHQEKSLTTLAELDGQLPQSFLWPFYTGQIQKKLGWKQEARRSYLQALRRMPDNVDVLRQLHELAIEESDFRTREQLAQRLWDLGHWQEGQIDLLRARGDRARALTAIKKRLERDPGDMSASLMLADVLVEQGQLKAAAQLLTNLRSLAPDRIDVASRRADLHDRMGQPEQAKTLRAALAKSHPWFLPVRRILAATEGNGKISVTGAERVDGLKLVRDFQKSGQRIQGNAVLLFDQASQEVARDGSSIERVHTIVQVLSPDGLEQWGEIDIIPPGAELEQLRTIGADGRIHEAEIMPGKDSITLPALSVGDFIEVAYVEGRRGGYLLADGFLSHGFLFRSPASPIQHALYTVAVPQYSDLTIDEHNGAPPHKQSHQDGYQILTFEQRDSPALAAELHAPPLHEITPLVLVGFGTSWSEVRDIMHQELRRATRATPGLREYALKVSAGAQGRAEQVRRLFEAVSQDIHRQGQDKDLSQSAAHILARREGNRLVILSALLRILEVDHQVLLARTIAHAQVDYKLPSDQSYSHGLLAVQLAGPDSAPVYLDPSARYNPFGVLFPFLSHMRAMDISAKAPAPVFVALPQKSGWELHKKIDLDLELLTDGTLFGRGQEQITTAQAVQYRALLTSMGPPQRRKALEAGLGGYFSGAILSQSKIEGLEDSDQALKISYQFRAPAYGRSIRSSLVLRGGFYPYQLGPNLIVSHTRQTPLLITDRTNNRTTARIKLPQGAQAVLPEAVEWQAPLSKFQMKFKQAGRELVIDKSLQIDPGRVSPEDYAKFRDFCHRVDSLETAGLEIKLSPSGASARVGLVQH